MKKNAYLLILIVVLAGVFTASPAEAGSLVIPAWAFSKGNVKIQVPPAAGADAGPIVVSGPKEHWGWRVSYEVDIPVDGKYTLQVCYAAAEPRPLNVFLDGAREGEVCSKVTFGPSDSPTWNRSGAEWEPVTRWGGQLTILGKKKSIKKGKHTISFTRRQPMPNLIAIRLDTEAEFPKDWTPPKYKVRNIKSIPAASRKLFDTPGPLPRAQVFSMAKPRSTLKIPACTFDRGNAKIYASPDKYALDGPLAGDIEGGDSKDGLVEYDINVPVSADYTLEIHYSAIKPRPTDVFLDGKKLGRACTSMTVHDGNFVGPHPFRVNSRNASRRQKLLDTAKGAPMVLPLTKGTHTLKFTRRGPLPHLISLSLQTASAFPKDWAPPKRKVDLSRVPVAHRGVFLPMESVNVAALRLAIQETMTEFGSRYPKGEQYLKELSKLEANQKAAQAGSAEKKKETDAALVTFRREVMLAHPMLDFDKLIFLQRSSTHYSHTYAGPQGRVMGGRLCVLSPVSPEGKVTSLVPELEGGLFGRFDLSYDAKKLIFTYKKVPTGPFRLYEIDLDPDAGTMVPGSLRQLTFGGKEEEEARKNQVQKWLRDGNGFCDMYPCYLPSGKIMFSSTRAQRVVYCAPQPVTTLYVMDADGKNMRRLSENPISETIPTVLNDGRVVYTRWEYLDKGLGSVQNLWSMRPDGGGVDHVYKLNLTWPAAMGATRAIPGSQKMVTIAGNHYQPTMGSLVVLDVRGSRVSPDAMHCVTPEVSFRHTYDNKLPTGAFCDPYPLTETFFLASHYKGDPQHVRDPNFGLCLVDGWGNRAQLYRDLKISSFEPMPLRPRKKPPEIVTSGIDFDNKQKPGTMFIQDIYEGLTGIERGRVKYVRVMGNLEWPWDQNGMSWSLGKDPHRKIIYGVAKVHKDGSAHFTVPAKENIFFQALDKDYMAVQEMATYLNIMPGESRSCVGCHESRINAPGMVSAKRTIALTLPPETPSPQPGDVGMRVVDFRADIMPILNKHCIRCHSGKKPDGGLDFVNVPHGKFGTAYDSLLGTSLVCYRGTGKAGIQFVPPLTHGSRASELTSMLEKGHKKVKLSREELIRFATWVDSNVPYYGTYRGVRKAEDKDHPQYRVLPVTMKKTKTTKETVPVSMIRTKRHYE